MGQKVKAPCNHCNALRVARGKKPSTITVHEELPTPLKGFYYCMVCGNVARMMYKYEVVEGS